MQICLQHVQAKFSKGVQTVAFGVDLFAAANGAPEDKISLKMGVTLWARSLHASLRMFLYFMLILISRLVCSESLSLALVGIFSMRAVTLAIFQFPSGLGSPFGIWSSTIHVVSDLGLSFSTWHLLFESNEKAALAMAGLEMCVSFHTLLLLIFFVMRMRCGKDDI